MRPYRAPCSQHPRSSARTLLLSYAITDDPDVPPPMNVPRASRLTGSLLARARTTTSSCRSGCFFTHARSASPPPSAFLPPHAVSSHTNGDVAWSANVGRCLCSILLLIVSRNWRVCVCVCVCQRLQACLLRRVCSLDSSDHVHCVSSLWRKHRSAPLDTCDALTDTPTTRTCLGASSR